MGCKNSTLANVAADKDRPTLLNAPKTYPKRYTEAEVSAEERAIIATFEDQNILKMLVAGNDDEKSSISSHTDDELERKSSFAEKKMNVQGSIADPTKSGLGFTCRKGLKPTSPNQDSWLILKTGDVSIYGVFDGHGEDGHNVSNFVKEALPKLLVKSRALRYVESRSNFEMEKMIKSCFKRTQSMIAAATRMSKIDAHLSGCTTTILIRDHVKDKLWVAWVGDSGACMATKAASGLVQVGLTYDHKPHLHKERSRIERSGGKVIYDGQINHRVYDKTRTYPGLNMSRALGDLLGNKDCGISEEPTVDVYDIQPEDQFIVICSDGVWEFVSYDEAVKMVGDFSPSEAMGAAEKLATEGWDKWNAECNGQVVDDITALVIYLHPETRIII